MTNSGRLMRRYLLGTATEAERTGVENDYLVNGDAFHELKEAENDLIDCYVRGELPIGERDAFEKRYLASVQPSSQASAQGRSRVEFARALGELAKEAALKAPRKEASPVEKFLAVFRAGTLSPAWRLGAACAVVLIIGLVSLRLLNHRGAGPSQTSRQIEHASESAAGTESAKDTPRIVAKNEVPETHEFTAQLEPDAVRAAGRSLQTLTVPSHTAWLSLGVVVGEDETRPLTVVVETPEGKEVFRSRRSEVITLQRGRVLRVRIPAARMPAGDYILEVTAPASDSKKEETVTSCSFRLTYN